jgi:hypothetical protein
LSGIQKDLGPKGLEVLEAAVNDNADLAGFQQQFKPPFPVGTTPAVEVGRGSRSAEVTPSFYSADTSTCGEVWSLSESSRVNRGRG